LKYEFEVPNGEYLVELYFIEPWLGIGGGMNCRDMRLFDVAINGKIVLNDLDIWKEAGMNTGLKKTVTANVTDRKMIISFPETKVGQALISAIAVATNENRGRRRGLSIYEDQYFYQEWLDVGDKQYANEDISFNSIPSELFGASWIQFANKQVKSSVTFQPDRDMYIYVALKRGTDSVQGFENINEEILSDENGGTVYKVYRKLCHADSILIIPHGAKAIIVRQPVNKMQPAYDLKSITQYRSDVVKLSDGVVKDSVNGRYCAVINTSNNVVIDYPIQTGVADIYSITMKYYYGKQTPVKGKLQLIGAGNTMMLDEEVQFTFTNIGKWNQFTINTGSMINAGNYSVRLVIENAEGLAISGIDIQ
jgi:hypothetical protein